MARCSWLAESILGRRRLRSPVLVARRPCTVIVDDAGRGQPPVRVTAAVRGNVQHGSAVVHVTVIDPVSLASARPSRRQWCVCGRGEGERGNRPSAIPVERCRSLFKTSPPRCAPEGRVGHRWSVVLPSHAARQRQRQSCHSSRERRDRGEHGSPCRGIDAVAALGCRGRRDP